jgi:hypothetical protein
VQSQSAALEFLILKPDKNTVKTKKNESRDGAFIILNPEPLPTSILREIIPVRVIIAISPEYT